MKGLKDLTGSRVGSLVAVKVVSTGPTKWLCRCDCGGSRIVSVMGFRPTKWKTFACKECKRRTLSALYTRHGAGKTRRVAKVDPLYSRWCGIKRRCSNPKMHNFKHYGGKGIRVCDAWQRFEGFRDWAMANGYAADLTIERVNPDWHYDPSNCEWVTSEVNSWRAAHPGHYWRSMTCDA
jgi:hypothetical protein